MAGIWDPPNADNTQQTPEGQSPRAGGPVPTVDPLGAIEGRDTGGPLLNASGRGVVNGVPYGQAQQTHAREVNAMWWFFPGAARRLRAATRSALRW